MKKIIDHDFPLIHPSQVHLRPTFGVPAKGPDTASLSWPCLHVSALLPVSSNVGVQDVTTFGVFWSCGFKYLSDELATYMRLKRWTRQLNEAGLCPSCHCLANHQRHAVHSLSTRYWDCQSARHRLLQRPDWRAPSTWYHARHYSVPLGSTPSSARHGRMAESCCCRLVHGFRQDLLRKLWWQSKYSVSL